MRRPRSVTRDCFTAAYKSADGKKIDGRRVLVDVERGRTVKGWRPRRLGGGLGSTRRSATDEVPRPSGRPEFRWVARLVICEGICVWGGLVIVVSCLCLAMD